MTYKRVYIEDFQWLQTYFNFKNNIPYLTYEYRHKDYSGEFFRNIYYINPYTGKVVEIEMEGVDNCDIVLRAPILSSAEVEKEYNTYWRGKRNRKLNSSSGGNC